MSNQLLLFVLWGSRRKMQCQWDWMRADKTKSPQIHFFWRIQISYSWYLCVGHRFDLWAENFSTWRHLKSDFGWVTLILCQAGSKGAGAGCLERRRTRQKLGMLLKRQCQGHCAYPHVPPSPPWREVSPSAGSCSSFFSQWCWVKQGKGVEGIEDKEEFLGGSCQHHWQRFSCREFPALDHHRPEQLLSSARPELTTGKGAINLDYFGICRSLLEL